MLSFAKVEKVVKPPHSPVVSNRYHELCVMPDLWNKENNAPNTRHPKKFIVNVAHGNPALPKFRISTDR